MSTPTQPRQHPWAALDLGSNSFHLLLAAPRGASFVTLERLKEKVQLLAGFEDGCIAPEAQARGLACLRRFAQRLTPVPLAQVVVMGTFALREAANAEAFTAAAAQILQVPVQVISGAYEAQLIYAAVAHHIGPSGQQRLVLDIGGGSTEIAWGNGLAAAHCQSVNIGCVAFKERFFNGSPAHAGFTAAKDAALTTLRAQLHGNVVTGMQTPAVSGSVFGTSGTLESIQTVLNANGWCRGSITRDGLSRLEAAIVDEHWLLEAGLPGLAPDRMDIFPAGVAILSACFEVLQVERCEYVDVSLLQGMIGERVVKAAEVDLREDSVQQLAARFDTDREQAARVSRCALALYAATRAWWPDDRYRDLLRWAAELHEIGVHISAKHYHRHGAYVVKHADLPGFSDEQQSMLALLIRGHRRSMPGLAFRAFDPDIAQQLLRLVALLRLAVIVERSHSDADSPDAQLQVAGNRLSLDCGIGWLETHPLSWRELQVEQQQQRSAGIELVLMHAPREQ